MQFRPDQANSEALKSKVDQSRRDSRPPDVGPCQKTELIDVTDCTAEASSVLLQKVSLLLEKVDQGLTQLVQGGEAREGALLEKLDRLLTAKFERLIEQPIVETNDEQHAIQVEQEETIPAERQLAEAPETWEKDDAPPRKCRRTVGLKYRKVLQ